MCLSQSQFWSCFVDFLNGNCVVDYGWQIGAELPMDSDDADEENKLSDGRTLLYVFERGSANYRPDIYFLKKQTIRTKLD